MPLETTIRMYNQQDLGDCFLLKFRLGEKNTYILIDFGSYKNDNTAREVEIAEDINRTVGDDDLTIVLTHQHKDHLSGFLHAHDKLKGKKRTLWLSFLDDEKSEEGKTLRSATESYWWKNKRMMTKLQSHFSDDREVSDMFNEKRGYDLFAEEQTGGDAISKLLEIAGKNVSFLKPGNCFFLPGMDEAVKVYVLGPPFDKKQLSKLSPGVHEEVHGLNSLAELADIDISGTLMLNALSALTDSEPYSRECDFPFCEKYINNQQILLKERYEENAQNWRRIDYEWLSEIGRLTLHMDRLTNNTSLVLAFELQESKKVLLFPGDAQIGNWQSWSNVNFPDSEVTAEDLLSRTIVYKAAHHSSYNATLRQSLDLMDEKELIILIPVHEKTSKSYNFAMLKPGMLKGYHRKSQGRVLRSDSIEQPKDNLALEYPFIKRADLAGKLTIGPPGGGGQDHLWIEIKVDE